MKYFLVIDQNMATLKIPANDANMVTAILREGINKVVKHESSKELNAEIKSYLEECKNG